jgi:hypothetical protein
MMVVRLSALRTGRLYPQEYTLYSFVLEPGLIKNIDYYTNVTVSLPGFYNFGQ